MAYLSSVCVWYTVWNLYEYLTLTKIYNNYILLATHFATSTFLILLNSNVSLYGFGQSPSENNNIEKNPEKFNLNLNLFRIKYLSLINEEL